MSDDLAKRVVRALVRSGGARYHGEWHTAECEADNAGVACDELCTETRNALRQIGVPVECPKGLSWERWAGQLGAWARGVPYIDIVSTIQ